MKRGQTWLVGALPLFICFCLLAIYLVSPDFYLRYILEKHSRETMAVEIITFTAAFLASVLLLAVASRFRKPGWRTLLDPAFLLVLATGAAALVFAGEEVSWGQTWFDWKTPADYMKYGGETNLHNTDLPVQELGSLFLTAVFIVLPLGYRFFSGKFAVLRSFGPVVPRLSAISFIVTGFVWKTAKSIYCAVTPETMQADYVPGGPVGFYGGFIEQVNEHKEMLVAVGLLVFAVQLVSTARRSFAGNARRT